MHREARRHREALHRRAHQPPFRRRYIVDYDGPRVDPCVNRQCHACYGPHFGHTFEPPDEFDDDEDEEDYEEDYEDFEDGFGDPFLDDMDLFDPCARHHRHGHTYHGHPRNRRLSGRDPRRPMMRSIGMG